MSDWKNDMRDRVSQKKQGGKFKLAEGENTIRILPSARGMKESPLVEFRVHRDVGPDERVVACGKNIYGKGDCWLCDVLIPKLMESESASKRQKAEHLQATDATIAQIAVVSHRTGKMDGPYTWWVPTGGGNALATRIMNMLAREGKSYEHPSKGFNLNIERTGTGKRDTRYSTPEADEESSSVPGEILDRLKPFDEIVPKYSRSEQEDAFYGRDDDDDRGRGRGRSRRFEEDDDRGRSRSRRDDDEPPRRSRDDDDDRSSRRSRDDDEPPRRSRDDDEPPRRSRDDDDDRSSRRSRDDDEPRRRSRDDDEPRRRSRDDDDDRRSRRDDDDDRKDEDSGKGEDDIPFDDSPDEAGETAEATSPKEDEPSKRPASSKAKKPPAAKAAATGKKAPKPGAGKTGAKRK